MAIRDKKKFFIFVALAFVLASGCSPKSNRTSTAQEPSPGTPTPDYPVYQPTPPISGGGSGTTDPNAGKTDGNCEDNLNCSVNELITLSMVVGNPIYRDSFNYGVRWSSKMGSTNANYFGTYYVSEKNKCPDRAFCTDSKFQVRVIPRTPTGVIVRQNGVKTGVKALNGRTCEYGRAFDEKVKYDIELRVRDFDSNSGPTWVWPRLSINQIGQVHSFRVTPSTSPVIVEVLNVNICIPPGYWSNNSDYICMSMNNDECMKFDLQISTTNTKSF